MPIYRSMGPQRVSALTWAGGSCYETVAKREVEIRYGVALWAGPSTRIALSVPPGERFGQTMDR
jgi:hypothetical protein